MWVTRHRSDFLLAEVSNTSFAKLLVSILIEKYTKMSLCMKRLQHIFNFVPEYTYVWPPRKKAKSVMRSSYCSSCGHRPVYFYTELVRTFFHYMAIFSSASIFSSSDIYMIFLRRIQSCTPVTAISARDLSVLSARPNFVR